MHFSVDILSKICYNIITLPMGEGPDVVKIQQKKDTILVDLLDILCYNVYIHWSKRRRSPKKELE